MNKGDIITNIDPNNYIGIGVVIGLYIGLFIGMFISVITSRKHRKKLRNNYRDMTNDDKEKILNLLDNISDDVFALYETSHVDSYKTKYNHILETITYIQELDTKT